MPLLCSFFWDSSHTQDFQNHGFIVSGQSSQKVTTTRANIDIGGTLGGTTYVCVYTNYLKEHTFNKLAVYDSTTIYYKKGKGIDYSHKHTIAEVKT